MPLSISIHNKKLDIVMLTETKAVEKVTNEKEPFGGISFLSIRRVGGVMVFTKKNFTNAGYYYKF